MNQYTVGQQLELKVSFANDDGDPIDPDMVSCEILQPDGTVVEPTPIQHAASGVFMVNFSPDQIGLHEYRFEASNSGVAVSAAESAFLTTTDFAEVEA